MSKVIEISEDNFESEVLKSELPVLVDFWAPWCGPCRMMGPIVDEISEENLELKVCKVNVDEASELAIKYDVESIPTLIYFKNGEVRATMIGLRTKQDIMNEIS
ncbi:MAG: thioredoxin [Clostridium sp. CAG:245_30_32]|jgi:thioredoxin 1|uniref:thioredoxin n=1 Tax=Candidatus Merdicola sp. TaxID=3085652 RepID=UPI0009661E0E|nr:MAG: thioredoxin [Clostridium sp. CAG:245_30_32]